MKCEACWREAQRMAKRGGAPDNAMRRVTKRIYLAHHIPTQPLSLSDPFYGPGPNELVTVSCKHIRPERFRRHKNGKVIQLTNGS